MRFITPFLIVLLMGFNSLLAQDPFITTWQTDNPGTSCNSCITLPTVGSGYNYDVDWNDDGTYDEFGLTTGVTHDFITPGTYTIRIKGSFPIIRFANQGDKDKIINIRQWGDIVWQSMHTAFSGCSNLNSDATDAPDLSNVTFMNNMFTNAAVFNASIGHWDVTNVTSMNGLFFFASTFNQNINMWNTINVTDMNTLFASATSYNQPMDNWKVENVEFMASMFSNATNFNQDISGWETGSATTMKSMFSGAASFNQPIGTWNTSAVENMNSMFRTTPMNQNLSDWNIENVTNLTHIFSQTNMSLENYDQTIISWSQQNVQSNIPIGAEGVLYCSCASQRQSLIDDHGWLFDGDTKACGPFIATFKTDNPGTSCNSCITIPIVNGLALYDVDWDSDGTYDQIGLTSAETHQYAQPGEYQVTIRGDLNFIRFVTSGDQEKILSIDQWGGTQWSSFSASFSECKNLHVLASDAPDLSGVTNLTSMFRNAKVMNEDISHWNMAGIEILDHMFEGAESFNQNLSSWNTSNVTSMPQLFRNAFDFNQNLGGWDISKVTDMSFMLDNSGISTENYDQLLISWAAQSVQSNVPFGAQGLHYCNGETDRDHLMTNQGWAITDGGHQSALNTWVGTTPLSWFDSRDNWGLEEFPTICTPVLLPKDANVMVSGIIKAVAKEMTINQGGIFLIDQGAELEIQP